MIQKTGDWGKAAAALAGAPAVLKEALRKAFLQEGQFFRTKVVEGITSQAPGGKQFRPLSPMTLAIRKLLGVGGTKALIERGDLRRSVTVTEHNGDVFVGIIKGRRSSDGRDLVNIAEIHERGSRPIVVKITPKMRALLAKAARLAGLPEKSGSGTGIIITRVPARPFFAPVWEKYGRPEDVRRRIEARLERLLKGKLS